MIDDALSRGIPGDFTFDSYLWNRRTLTTIGEACRAVKRELLERLVDWIVDKIDDDDWALSQIKAVLAQA